MPQRVTASSDGTLIASGGFDGDVTVWETTSWSVRPALPRQKWGVESLRFSPDNRTLYVADEAGRIAVIDLLTSREVRSIRGMWLLGRYGSADSAFSPDGGLVAIARNPNKPSERRTITVDVFSTLTRKRVGRIPVTDELRVSMMCFTPDSKSLIVGPYDSEVRAYDIATGQTKYRLEGVDATSRAIDVSGPLNELAIFDWNTVVRFDATTGSRRGVLAFRGEEAGGKHTSIDWLAIDDAGRFLATADTGNWLRLWNRQSGECICDLTRFSTGPGQVVFVPGKNLLVSTSYTSKLYVFDVSPYVPAAAVKP